MEQQRTKYLAKNTALFALNSIGTKVITFLLVPIYTKAFTTAEYGTVDLITTIATLLVPLITINIGEAVMRFALDEDTDKNDIMSIGLFFVALSLVLGTSIVFILTFFPDIEVSRKMVYFYCVFQGIYQTLSCNLRGQEKLFNYAVANILNTLLAAAFNIIFLLGLKIGINGYFYAYIIAFILSGIYCFVTGDVIRTIRHFKIDKKLLKSMAQYSIVLVPNSFMWWIMNSSDHIMVTSMIGIAANGIYAISYKIPSILSAFSTVFNQAWSYSAIHENKSIDREEFNNQMYDKLIQFQAIVTVLLMCVMKFFMKIYVQSEYYTAWEYTPYLLIGNFFLTMGTFLSTSYTVNKDSRGFLFSGSIGALVNLMLNGILIPVMHIHGAALATCISYITVFLYRVKDTKKYMIIHVFKREYILNYFILVLTGCTMAIPSYLGQILLFLEAAGILIINKRFVIECLNMAMHIAGKRNRNENGM